jgi:hypothetical protein
VTVAETRGAFEAMTLGADIAPAQGRAEFLGVWRVFGDIGTAGGPLAVAGVTAAVALGPAVVCTGVLGLAAAALVAAIVPETGPRGRRSHPRAREARSLLDADTARAGEAVERARS